MEKEQNKKIFLMWVMVGSLVLGIFLLWSFNLKNVWKNASVAGTDKNSENWSAVRNDLDETLAIINNRMKKENDQEKANTAGAALLSNLVQETKTLAANNVPAVVSPVTPVLLATSTSESSNDKPTSGFPDSAPVINNECPKYIDCMPSIGAAKPCQIPVGCEGITKIAY